MKTTTFKLTNQEMITLIKEYQETQDNVVFGKIHEEVYPMVKGLAVSFYSSSRRGIHNNMVEDYINEAEFAIYKAVLNYDVAIGSPFNSFLKQTVEWTLQDNLTRKRYTKAEQFYETASLQSFDKDMGNGSESYSLADLVPTSVQNPDKNKDADIVFDEVMEKLEAESETETNPIIAVITQFKTESTASADEFKIVHTIFETIMRTMTINPRAINKELNSAFPDTKPASVRVKKCRALVKFSKFAESKGFYNLDISQL